MVTFTSVFFLPFSSFIWWPNISHRQAMPPLCALWWPHSCLCIIPRCSSLCCHCSPSTSSSTLESLTLDCVVNEHRPLRNHINTYVDELLKKWLRAHTQNLGEEWYPASDTSTPASSTAAAFAPEVHLSFPYPPNQVLFAVFNDPS